MKKQNIELENQLKKNIDAHLSILKISDDIFDESKKFIKNYAKVEKYYSVEMVAQLLMLNT